MCGILGFAGTYNQNTFSKALNNLTHRGPDGQGIWKNENLILGHNRLAIIDISNAGSQPMMVGDKYIITFNGEIYNYLELRAELEKKGHSFISYTDTEVIVKSYMQWGTDCLNKFNGMWAFAIYDLPNNQLFLSRDRLGEKPLFYSQNNNSFAFASEMKGLYPFLPTVDVAREIFDMAVADNFSYEHTENCLVKGIKRFPAGYFGFFNLEQKSFSLHQYWNPLKNINLSDIPGDYTEQVELFRKLFLDSCKIRMRADVKIGTALSGGLDSSSVICSMNFIDQLGQGKRQGVQKDWQHAFIASFPDTSFDETTYGLKVADYLGIDKEVVEIDPEKNIDDIFYHAYLFEEVYYAPTIPFMQLYNKIKQKGVKVTLDGHGADELLGGYHFDAYSALIDALPNIAEFNNIYQTIVDTENNNLPSRLQCLKFSLLNKYKCLGSLSKNTNLKPKVQGLKFYNSSLFIDTYTTILPTLLRNYDRYAMANGVEVRMPFLDYRLVQLAFSIPYSSKIRNGYLKSIERDAMIGIVPEEIRLRKQKLGFNSPLNSWIKGKFKQWIADNIHSVNFNNGTLYNPGFQRQKINALLKKEQLSSHEGRQVYEYLVPYIWEQSYRGVKRL